MIRRSTFTRCTGFSAKESRSVHGSWTEWQTTYYFSQRPKMPNNRIELTAASLWIFESLSASPASFTGGAPFPRGRVGGFQAVGGTTRRLHLTAAHALRSPCFAHSHLVSA